MGNACFCPSFYPCICDNKIFIVSCALTVLRTLQNHFTYSTFCISYAFDSHHHFSLIMKQPWPEVTWLFQDDFINNFESFLSDFPPVFVSSAIHLQIFMLICFIMTHSCFSLLFSHVKLVILILSPSDFQAIIIVFPSSKKSYYSDFLHCQWYQTPLKILEQE